MKNEKNIDGLCRKIKFVSKNKNSFHTDFGCGDATISVNGATMSAKDAKYATISAKDTTLSAKDATMRLHDVSMTLEARVREGFCENG